MKNFLYRLLGRQPPPSPSQHWVIRVRMSGDPKTYKTHFTGTREEAHEQGDLFVAERVRATGQVVLAQCLVSLASEEDSRGLN